MQDPVLANFYILLLCHAIKNLVWNLIKTLNFQENIFDNKVLLASANSTQKLHKETYDVSKIFALSIFLANYGVFSSLDVFLETWSNNIVLGPRTDWIICYTYPTPSKVIAFVCSAMDVILCDISTFKCISDDCFGALLF